MMHVAGTGIFKYIFTCLSNIIGLGKTKEREKEELDNLHQLLSSQSIRQSDKAFPRTSMCNGIIDGTKCVAKKELEI